MIGKYEPLSVFSTVLMVAGILSLAAGALLVVSTVQDFNDNTLLHNPAIGVTKLLGAAPLLIDGILLCALSQIIRAFIDIATNTAVLPEMLANTAKTVSFFEHITGNKSAEASDQPPPKRPAPTQEGVYQGYKWRKYEDESVETEIRGEWKRFKDGDDFMMYVNRRII